MFESLNNQIYEKKTGKYLFFFSWFAKWDDFRTTDWDTTLKYPELVMKETERLLAIVK